MKKFMNNVLFTIFQLSILANTILFGYVSCNLFCYFFGFSGFYFTTLFILLGLTILNLLILFIEAHFVSKKFDEHEKD